mmetsp:Transcript_79865/g.140945  ORF Transcript_79865/g.140945 Transcript_79865/m.140945 type:complete len:207 (-) Transcript_79865:268-888(-)
MKLPNGGSGTGRRHPGSFPRLFLLHCLQHGALRGKAHLSHKQLLEPQSLESMREDVVEGGDFTADEGKIGHCRRDDVPVEVQAILLDCQLLLCRLIEETIALPKPSAVDHHICLELRTVGQHHTILHEVVDGALDAMHLALAQQIAVLIVQDLSACEEIDLNRDLRHSISLEVELKAKHELHDAPEEPFQGHEYCMEPCGHWPFFV